MKIIANSISIEVEDSAQEHAQDAHRPVVLLIMGLGMQLTAWPPEMVDGLRAAGYRVIRFDNRDSGLSQSFDVHGKPKLLWAALKHQLGLRVASTYSLADMARDARGVLDALQVPRAHVVAVSMGAMIAQHLALLAPERVASLVSIMSTSGARGLPGPAPAVRRALLKRPPAPRGPQPSESELDAMVDHFERFFELIKSPAYPNPRERVRSRVRESLRRSFHPNGTARQLVAVAADHARAAALAQIRVPTLVLHGAADPFVPLECGRDTARRIPGARLEVIEGMGHDLAPGVVEQLLVRSLPFLQQHLS
jgi:pimeloyl-ACP methyl ester carboxylesterase